MSIVTGKTVVGFLCLIGGGNRGSGGGGRGASLSAATPSPIASHRVVCALPSGTHGGSSDWVTRARFGAAVQGLVLSLVFLGGGAREPPIGGVGGRGTTAWNRDLKCLSVSWCCHK